MKERIRQRRQQANYINTAPGEETPVYALMGAGFKTLDEKPAAQTKSRRYIVDKSATKTISGYDWSTSFDADQIRSQAAISFIMDIAEKLKIGEDAETDYVIVDLDQPISNKENTFHARKIDVAVEVADTPNDDGEMGCSGNLLGQSDFVEGEFNTSTKTFTAAT